VLLVTVGVQRLSALGYLQAKMNPDDEVLTAKDYLGNQSDKQVNQQARQEMVDSQMFAAVAALRRLGYPIVEQGEGATIQEVDQNTPAAGHLKVGDLVTEANGKAVSTAQDLRTLIQALKPGDVLTAKVTGPEQAAAPRTETVKLGARPEPDRAGVAFLGVVFVTHNQHFDMPFQVHFGTGDIGGPSAGLAFTLGLIDDLSPGELTGGKKVAATGTIDPTGIVGPIGGAAQKTVAVIRQNADVFLVPADSSDYCPALAKARGRVKIVPVRTLEDAVNALHSMGGDTSPLPPSPSTLPQSSQPITTCPPAAAKATGK
jgi:PDZ domain-containing protein